MEPPAGIGPPANQLEGKVHQSPNLLPFIWIIITIKVKVIRKTKR